MIRDGLQTPRTMSGRQLALLTICGALVFSVFMFGHRYLDGVARGRPGPVAPVLIEEVTAALGSVPLLLFLVWWVRRSPLGRHTWRRRLLPYLVLTVALAVLHTLWMLASRAILFPLAGLAPYDYGRLGPRILMELPTQLLGQGSIIGFSHFAAYYRATRDKELHAARLEAQLARADLTALQSQLHPHFLFNTMNAISSLMYEDAAAADRMMTGLSDLLRQMLSHRALEIPRLEELQWLDRYVAIIRMRFRDRLTVTYDVPTNTKALLVPSLVLQPLVENSVKHGVAARTGPATITILVRREGATLRIMVTDDGPGLRGTPPAGLGITNTAARLATLYGAAGTLVVGNAPAGGCRATLRMPAHTRAS